MVLVLVVVWLRCDSGKTMWGVKSRCVNLNSGLTVDKDVDFWPSPHHRITHHRITRGKRVRETVR